MQPWFILAAAIALEVIGTAMLKQSDGFSKPLPSVLVLICYGGAFFGLSIVLRKIDMSVAYAIWSGVGTAVVAVIGVVYFQENMTVLKFISLALIVIGVVGLNLSGAKH